MIKKNEFIHITDDNSQELVLVLASIKSINKYYNDYSDKTYICIVTEHGNYNMRYSNRIYADDYFNKLIKKLL